MTDIASQNLAIAKTFIEQFLGQGNMGVADEVIDPSVQVITGLKPNEPINGLVQRHSLVLG